MKILIIDDDKALAKSLQLQLTPQGHEVHIVHLALDGLNEIKTNIYELVLLDLTLPDMSGLDVLKKLDSHSHKTKIIVISGREDMDSTIKAIQLGATDFIRKPLDMDMVYIALEKIKKENHFESKTTDPPHELANTNNISSREIIGNHPLIIEILKKIGLLSRNKINVLIEGGSGSGKELIARALHKNGCPKSPFIPINCSAVVDNLLESELFGYEKGSFTGAYNTKKGKFEIAADGVIFFDEIGEMSLNLQAKLLRVLQEREFERVGGSISIPIHCRAIFATHRNLEEMVVEGKFREDLYYRIAVGKLSIPDLKNRKSDIPLLVNYLLKKLKNQFEFDAIHVNPDAMEFLIECDWPGNVRQLENILLRVVSMNTKDYLEKSDFQEHIQLSNSDHSNNVSIKKESPKFDMPLAQMEANYILGALNSMDWNITHTATLLEISPTTLRKKIKDYSLIQP